MANVSTARNETRTPASVNGSEPVIDPAALVALGAGGRRRRWPVALLGAAVGAAGTIGAYSVIEGRADTDEVETTPVELATASVEQRDLVEEIEWSGVLGYGEPVTLTGSGGIVTATTAVGSTIGRGDAIAGVDGQPVVALYGNVPMWRPLAEGDSGQDVRQLEANLAALGYDPDQTVDIDETFTANTAAMVGRWQEELGVEDTGSVALGSVLIIGGPSVVSAAPEVGSSASGQLMVVAPQSTVIDVVAEVDGTTTSIAPAGTVVGHGTVLYEVDGIPVVALIESDPVATALGDSTFEELELERALAAAGHDPEAAMTVDGVISEATRAAVERWQRTAGLPVSGETDPGYYLVLPAGHTVAEHLVDDGEDVIDGGPISTISSSRLSVEVTVEVAGADEFEVGDDVTIEMADGTTAEGLVTEIGPVVQTADPQGSPTVTVDIAVVAGDEIEPIEGPVLVRSSGNVITDATVVPTRGLVSLAEGGFAVEKVEPDGTSALIGIEIGSFDDGVVEVTDGDLSPGDQVVVPR